MKLALPLFAALALNPLLSRIAARLSAADYSTLTQTETEEDLDAAGKATATRVCRSSLDTHADGGTHYTVVSASEDGKEVTDKIRAFRDARAKKNRAAGKPENGLDLEIEQRLPFEASEQPKYDFVLHETDGGLPWITFAPKKKDSRGWVGTAVVEPESGRLVRLEGRPSTLPRFVDSLSLSMEFGPEVPGGTLPSKLVIEGGGHFLFFDKRMRYTCLNADFSR